MTMSQIADTKEILIVGAELARYGVAVRIIDRAPQPTQTSKALVIWSRTLELIDRMGCTRDFLDRGLASHGGTIRSGTRILGRATFDEVDSPYNYALMIPQSETERLMGAHLGRLGVTVERQVELIGFADRSDCVEARLRHADGREETFATPWLIGCDGAHSAVRHCAGMEFSGSTEGGNWMLADVRLEGDGSPPRDEVATYLHPDGPFVIFPQPDGRARIVAQIGETDRQARAPIRHWKRFKRSPRREPAAVFGSVIPSGLPRSGSMSARCRPIVKAESSSPATRRIFTARPAAKA
jgi:2-polyprenyl-6-methoxyphenol hydroxylase-like FAD-dependent oxidoreductase